MYSPEEERLIRETEEQLLTVLDKDCFVCGGRGCEDCGYDGRMDGLMDNHMPHTRQGILTSEPHVSNMSYDAVRVHMKVILKDKQRLKERHGKPTNT